MDLFGVSCTGSTIKSICKILKLAKTPCLWRFSESYIQKVVSGMSGVSGIVETPQIILHFPHKTRWMYNCTAHCIAQTKATANVRAHPRPQTCYL